jgi:hypothetical protein
MRICDFQGCTNVTRRPFFQCWHHRICAVLLCGKKCGSRDKYCSAHRARLTRGRTFELRRIPTYRTLSSNGYMRVKVPSGGYRYEHRVIAEKIIGRKLLSHEVVHHIDGNRLNNNPDNLRICTKRTHKDHHSSLHSRDDAIRSIWKCSEDIGMTPTLRQFEKWIGSHCLKTIVRLFGSWLNAIIASGLAPTRLQLRGHPVESKAFHR